MKIDFVSFPRRTARFRAIALATAALGTLCAVPASAAPRETVLHAFSGKVDGLQPQVGVQMNAAGELFGTTTFGGANGWGMVYRLTPPVSGQGAWTEANLHDFTNGADGGSPWAPVTILADGSLLGSTLDGGSGGSGELWQLTPPMAAGNAWVDTPVSDFVGGSASTGAPIGGLLAAGDGGYYGVTSGSSDCGSVYKLSAPAGASGARTLAILHAFACDADGRRPQNRLVADPAGNLYGTTEEDGALNSGTVFRLAPPQAAGGAWTKTTLFDFDLTHGAQPRSGVTLLPDGSVVGTTFAGGVFGMGVAYRLVPPASGMGPWEETVVHTFTGRDDGRGPDGGLVADAHGGLLGTASAGGANGNGVVFRLLPSNQATWALKPVYAFAGGADGANPVGDLLVRGGRVYGVTEGNLTSGASSTVYMLER